MNEKEIVVFIKEHLLKAKEEIGEQHVASYFQLFNEPFTNIKDIDLLIREAKNFNITIQYAQKSKFYRNFKNDNFQTIVAFFDN